MTTPLSRAVPKRFAHLIEPYAASDSIVIAETTSLSAPGSRGMRKITTALVPLNCLKQVVNGGGAQGWLRT